MLLCEQEPQVRVCLKSGSPALETAFNINIYPTFFTLFRMLRIQKKSHMPSVIGGLLFDARRLLLEKKRKHSFTNQQVLRLFDDDSNLFISAHEWHQGFRKVDLAVPPRVLDIAWELQWGKAKEVKLQQLQAFIDTEETKSSLIQKVESKFDDFTKWDEIDIAKLGVMAKLPESLVECFSPQAKRVYEMVSSKLLDDKPSELQNQNNNDLKNNTGKPGRKALSRRVLFSAGGPRMVRSYDSRHASSQQKPPPAGLPPALAHMLRSMHTKINAVNAINTIAASPAHSARGSSNQRGSPNSNRKVRIRTNVASDKRPGDVTRALEFQRRRVMMAIGNALKAANTAARDAKMTARSAKKAATRAQEEHNAELERKFLAPPPTVTTKEPNSYDMMMELMLLEQQAGRTESPRKRIQKQTTKARADLIRGPKAWHKPKRTKKRLATTKHLYRPVLPNASNSLGGRASKQRNPRQKTRRLKNPDTPDSSKENMSRKAFGTPEGQTCGLPIGVGPEQAQGQNRENQLAAARQATEERASCHVTCSPMGATRILDSTEALPPAVARPVW